MLETRTLDRTLYLCCFFFHFLALSPPQEASPLFGDLAIFFCGIRCFGQCVVFPPFLYVVFVLCQRLYPGGGGGGVLWSFWVGLASMFLCYRFDSGTPCDGVGGRSSLWGKKEQTVHLTLAFERR